MLQENSNTDTHRIRTRKARDVDSKSTITAWRMQEAVKRWRDERRENTIKHTRRCGRYFAGTAELILALTVVSSRHTFTSHGPHRPILHPCPHLLHVHRRLERHSIILLPPTVWLRKRLMSFLQHNKSYRRYYVDEEAASVRYG